jgi:hypothetical protein
LGDKGWNQDQGNSSQSRRDLEVLDVDGAIFGCVANDSHRWGFQIQGALKDALVEQDRSGSMAYPIQSTDDWLRVLAGGGAHFDVVEKDYLAVGSCRCLGPSQVHRGEPR